MLFRSVVIFEFEDTIGIADEDASISFLWVDTLRMGCCWYHGKAANIVNPLYRYRYDQGWIYDDVARYDILERSEERRVWKECRFWWWRET